MKLNKAGKPITKEEMEQVAKELGIKIPDDLVGYYLAYNGGVPSRPYFYSEGTGVEIEVQNFLPFKYKRGESGRTVEEKYLLFKQKSSLMADYLPFANDYGANPICMNLSSGGIYVVWMDQGELGEDSFMFLADDFNVFLEGMDEESVEFRNTNT